MHALFRHAIFQPDTTRQICRRWYPDTVLLNSEVFTNQPALHRYIHARIEIEQPDSLGLVSYADGDLAVFVMRCDAGTHRLTAALWGATAEERERRDRFRAAREWHQQQFPQIHLAAAFQHPHDVQSWEAAE